MGSKGLGGHARIRGGGGAGGGQGGGGAGGMDPIEKSHVIWVDLDLKPLPHLAKFPGTAHGGDLFHWNALEQIA